MRDHGLTRRVLLRGAAAGAAVSAAAATAGCSEQRPPAAAPTAPPDPDTALLTRLIAGKERLIALYRQAARGTPRLAAALRPFEQRHQAHLAELRRRLPGGGGAASADALPSGPPDASPGGGPGVEPATEGPDGAATPSPAASAAASPEASAPVVSVARLRAAERAAAASRAGQLADASPALAQLVACIGACEAAHAIALPVSRPT